MAQREPHVWDAHTKRVKSWVNGEIFRPGKTRREKETGVWYQHLRNKDARRDENRSGGRKRK